MAAQGGSVAAQGVTLEHVVSWDALGGGRDALAAYAESVFAQSHALPPTPHSPSFAPQLPLRIRTLILDLLFAALRPAPAASTSTPQPALLPPSELAAFLARVHALARTAPARGNPASLADESEVYSAAEADPFLVAVADALWTADNVYGPTAADQWPASDESKARLVEVVVALMVRVVRPEGGLRGLGAMAPTEDRAQRGCPPEANDPARSANDTRGAYSSTGWRVILRGAAELVYSIMVVGVEIRAGEGSGDGWGNKWDCYTVRPHWDFFRQSEDNLRDSGANGGIVVRTAGLSGLLFSLGSSPLSSDLSFSLLPSSPHDSHSQTPSSPKHQPTIHHHQPALPSLPPLLLLRLDPDLLFTSRLIPTPVVHFSRKAVRIHTSASLRQQRHNVLREDTEGWSRCVAELAAAPVSRAEVLDALRPEEAKDMSAEDKARLADAIVARRAARVHKVVNALVGYFDLDPTRVLDVIVDAMVGGVREHAAFWVQVVAAADWARRGDGAGAVAGAGAGPRHGSSRANGTAKTTTTATTDAEDTPMGTPDELEEDNDTGMSLSPISDDSAPLPPPVAPIPLLAQVLGFKYKWHQHVYATAREAKERTEREKAEGGKAGAGTTPSTTTSTAPNTATPASATPATPAAAAAAATATAVGAPFVSVYPTAWSTDVLAPLELHLCAALLARARLLDLGSLWPHLDGGAPPVERETSEERVKREKEALEKEVKDVDERYKEWEAWVKEEDGRWSGVESGGGNALTNADALTDEADQRSYHRAPASSSSSTATIALPPPSRRLRPPSQRSGLIAALLSVGCVVPALRLMDRTHKGDGVVKMARTHPDILPLLCRAIKACISPLYEPVKGFTIPLPAQYAEQQCVATASWRAAEEPRPVRRGGRYMRDYVFATWFDAAWSDAVGRWNAGDEALWGSKSTGVGLVELCGYLGPEGLARDMACWTRVVRVARGEVDKIYPPAPRDEDGGRFSSSRQRDDVARVPPSTPGAFASLRAWLHLTTTVLLPALSMTRGNAAAASEAWKLLGILPVKARMGLYEDWKKGRWGGLEGELMRKRAEKEVRGFLRRLSAETVKVHGRRLGKVTHCNPIGCAPIIIYHVTGYENIISPLVESARYIGDLTFDALGYAMLEILTDPSRVRTSDGSHASPWLQNVAAFAGALGKKFTSPGMDIEALLRHIFSQVAEEGDPWDLVVLRELVDKMAGVQPPLPELTADQLESMAGSDALRRDVFGYAPGVRRSGDKLKKSLVEHNLVVAMAVAVSQLRAKVVFRRESVDEELKPLAGVYDQIQATLLQYVEFLNSDFNPKKYHELIVPDVQTLCKKFGLELEIAFLLKRPQLLHSINEWNAKYGLVLAEKSADAATKTDDSTSKPTELTDLTDDKEFDPPTPDPEEAPEGPWIELPSVHNQRRDPWHPALRDTIVQVAGLVPQHVWTKISPHFFVTFWQLSMYDLKTPARLYDTVREKEVRRRDQTLAALNAGRMDSQTTRNKRKEYERALHLANTMMADKREQEINRRNVLRRLRREKDDWFSNFASRDDSVAAVSMMIEQCFFPRAMLSHADAAFTAKFVMMLHELDTPYFSLITFLNEMVTRLQLVLSGATENESRHLGAFMFTVLEQYHKMFRSEKDFLAMASGRRGLVPTFPATPDKPHVTWELFRKFLIVTHERACKILIWCLSSKDYVKCRNAIILVNSMSRVFPATRMHVIGGYVQESQNLGPALKAVVQWADAEKLNDLKLLATACKVNLEKQPKHIFLTTETEFMIHTKQKLANPPATPATASATPATPTTVQSTPTSTAPTSTINTPAVPAPSSQVPAQQANTAPKPPRRDEPPPSAPTTSKRDTPPAASSGAAAAPPSQPTGNPAELRLPPRPAVAPSRALGPSPPVSNRPSQPPGPPLLRTREPSAPGAAALLRPTDSPPALRDAAQGGRVPSPRPPLLQPARTSDERDRPSSTDWAGGASQGVSGRTEVRDVERERERERQREREQREEAERNKELPHDKRADGARGRDERQIAGVTQGKDERVRESGTVAGRGDTRERARSPPRLDSNAPGGLQRTSSMDSRRSAGAGASEAVKPPGAEREVRGREEDGRVGADRGRDQVERERALRNAVLAERGRENAGDGPRSGSTDGVRGRDTRGRDEKGGPASATGERKDDGRRGVERREEGRKDEKGGDDRSVIGNAKDEKRGEDGPAGTGVSAGRGPAEEIQPPRWERQNDDRSWRPDRDRDAEGMRRGDSWARGDMGGSRQDMDQPMLGPVPRYPNRGGPPPYAQGPPPRQGPPPGMHPGAYSGGPVGRGGWGGPAPPGAGGQGRGMDYGGPGPGGPGRDMARPMPGGPFGGSGGRGAPVDRGGMVTQGFTPRRGIDGDRMGGGVSGGSVASTRGPDGERMGGASGPGSQAVGGSGGVSSSGVTRQTRQLTPSPPPPPPTPPPGGEGDRGGGGSGGGSASGRGVFSIRGAAGRMKTGGGSGDQGSEGSGRERERDRERERERDSSTGGGKDPETTLPPRPSGHAKRPAADDAGPREGGGRTVGRSGSDRRTADEGAVREGTKRRRVDEGAEAAGAAGYGRERGERESRESRDRDRERERDKDRERGDAALEGKNEREGRGGRHGGDSGRRGGDRQGDTGNEAGGHGRGGRGGGGGGAGASGTVDAKAVASPARDRERGGGGGGGGSRDKSRDRVKRDRSREKDRDSTSGREREGHNRDRDRDRERDRERDGGSKREGRREEGKDERRSGRSKRK
ncbi:hypothetical protein M427DRAFT_30267 [Gonapodya prolifera JEL478]|uniref:THO complex subunit 2 n=1 Tax=Gonapodya prolifera (strain JEL478) TaxID=1344416 RepID=A0A139AM13_GONPJ|nr:hypothetical protein M427DRAFT_30267 [Gonapodya prolifera JEL478]|eukprot:KXS17816.1 hypothetical protein M427DRAFT_30267 [Gonapodya prolifera JEL478]